MPLEVEKDTYMDAEGAILRGLTHDMLKAINSKVEALTVYDQGIVNHCQTQVKECDSRFKKLEISWARIAAGVLGMGTAWGTATGIILKIAGVL